MNDQDVSDLLKRTWGAVESAGVPEHLHQTAFEAALSLLTGESRLPGDTDVTGQVQSNGHKPTDGGSLLGKTAAALRVGLPELERVFEVTEDGIPELNLESRRLPNSTSEAAQEIALLVMAARQLGGIEQNTEAETIRMACRAYGKFDSNNFAAHMKALDHLVLFEGKGVSAKLKLTRPGREAVAKLVQKYAVAGD
jgi:hypothetical protein